MDKWVSKIEATNAFKVTERTLDNWVKAKKIQKERRNGQIMYEIGSFLAEKNITVDEPAPPVKKALPLEPKGPSSNELVLEARLDEKQNQIAILSESLENRQKDLNTLVMERGTLTEKSNLLTVEAESLREQRESLQKAKDEISETSFSKGSVYLIFFLSFLLSISLLAFAVFLFKTHQIGIEELKEAYVTDKIKIEEKWQSENSGLENRVKEEKAERMLSYENHEKERKALSEEIKKLSEMISKEKLENLSLQKDISAKSEEKDKLQARIEEIQKREKEYLLQTDKLKEDLSKFQIKIAVQEHIEKQNSDDGKSEKGRKPKNRTFIKEDNSE